MIAGAATQPWQRCTCSTLTRLRLWRGPGWQTSLAGVRHACPSHFLQQQPLPHKQLKHMIHDDPSQGPLDRMPASTYCTPINGTIITSGSARRPTVAPGCHAHVQGFPFQSNCSTPRHCQAAELQFVHVQTYEGGLGGEPGNEAHGGYTYCGLAALILADRVDVLNLPSLLHWAVHRQVNSQHLHCLSFWALIFILLLLLLPDSPKGIVLKTTRQSHTCGNLHIQYAVVA